MTSHICVCELPSNAMWVSLSLVTGRVVLKKHVIIYLKKKNIFFIKIYLLLVTVLVTY